MKSLFTLFLSLIITLFTVACQSEDLHNAETKDRVAVDVSLSINQDSRISYSPDFVLNFSPNDEMEIMERNLMDVTTLVYNYDQGQFLGKIYVPRDAESYEVCTHVGAKSYTAEKATFEISSSQLGSAGVYLAGLWQLTDFEDLSLQMAQMSSMLAFTVKPSAQGISEIILESVAGEMIAGTAEYNYDKLEYTINGTSSKISVKPVASPTSATQYVINILPVSLSKGAYLTIVDKKGNKMRLTLNYDNVCNFDVNKVVILPDVINQQNVGVELGKVYSSYTVDEVPTPNNNLDGSTIWVEQSRSVGISTHLVKEAGLYIDGVKHKGTYSSDGTISGLTLSGQKWNRHEVKAYIVDDENVEYISSAKGVDVTGLPYSVSFAGVSSTSLYTSLGWYSGNLTSVGSNMITLRSEGFINSPAFYVPNSISVVTNVKNVSNETNEASRVINIAPVVYNSSLSSTIATTIAANYASSYSPNASACKDSNDSGAFNLTSSKSSVQYGTSVSSVIVWQPLVLAINAITIKYSVK